MSEENKDLGDKAEEAAKAPQKTPGKLKSEVKKTTAEFKEGLKSISGENKRILAGMLALLFGGFGIHKFVLGYNKEGAIMLTITLVLGVLTCGIGASIAWLIGLIEGIIYLTQSEEAFYKTYQEGKKPWF